MPSPEISILLLAIKSDHADSKYVSEAGLLVSSGGVDWDELYRLAELHTVRPQLAKLISTIDTAGVPEGFLIKIGEAYKDTLHSQLNFAAEFLKIRGMLVSERIEIVPFKGFWLGYDAYGNMADREGFDVDVFVSAGKLGRVKEIMMSAGYTVEPAFRNMSTDEVRQISQEYVFERINNGVSRFRIEFHWGISPPGYGLGISLEDLRSQVTQGRFEGKEIRVFTPTAHMLLLLFHHGGDDRFIRLKQVYDISVMLKTHPDIDWQWVLRIAEKFGAGELVYTGVALASELTGADVPAPLIEGASKRKTRRLVSERIRLLLRSADGYFGRGFPLRNFMFRMRTRDGLRLKLKITLATLKALAGKMIRGSEKRELPDA
ncbi:MAG: nucleotidyltransferase family protein [Bacteroidales bacterium]|jgi:hypothetical protein|nr:nucleotidyltransferase family protein [Bacteroidales bacterium]HHV03343.1 nucleotidyltransferase family protein [Bacteroidales bacterium]HMT66692.1 nucleotidyltransferase family protein [Bacteroidales bacterium]HNV67696.1 nucleotidyltransferase family protein [Bacteroidales bacterium]